MKSVLRVVPPLLLVAAFAVLLAFRFRHVEHVASASATLEELQRRIPAAIGFGKSSPGLNEEATAIVERVQSEQRLLLAQVIEAERKKLQEQEQTARKNEEQRFLMQVLVSLCILLASLFVVLSSRYAPKDKHWAYGALGTILGFWLKA